MLGICSKCGNHTWDKIVEGNKITCPKCGNKWTFIKLPIYFLSGCSGIGKTTTGIELQKITTDFVIQDVDLLRNIMQPQNEQDEIELLETVYGISKNITQTGKPVVWTMAGGLDKLPNTYGKRFFSDIKVLALTAEPEIIRKRMSKGRGINDENWIQSSVDYNEYFRTHDTLGETKFEKLDCSTGTPKEIAEKVLAWLKEN